MMEILIQIQNVGHAILEALGVFFVISVCILFNARKDKNTLRRLARKVSQTNDPVKIMSAITSLNHILGKE